MTGSKVNTDISDKKLVFTDVLLPVPIPRYFTYKIPDYLIDRLDTGYRVIVQFGKKILTGIIWEKHDREPENYKARYLLDVIDDEPVLTGKQMNLLGWIAEYYMCTPGEVLNAALPTGLKLSSESLIQLHPEFKGEENTFSDKELELLKSLEFEKSLTYPQAARILDIKNIYHILKSLIQKEAIIIYEEIREGYKPKKIKKVKINPQFLKDNQLENLFDSLEKQPKQVDVLLKYLQYVPVYEDPGRNTPGIDKNILLKDNISKSSYNTLKKNGILNEFEIHVPRFSLPESPGYEVNLSPEQQDVKKQITDSFSAGDTTLLHGITGSGKTEIYLDLIRGILREGKQVLYLLPEIALTTQIVERLLKVFGNEMGVYHSKYSDNERVEVWKGILNHRFKLVVGVRSSIFLPFENLGLIIVDEEQDNSFKQQEPAPRYHARDVALYLGHLHGAKTLLGSATPSLESYFLAKNGKYGYVSLKKRFGESILPQIRLVNILKERKNKTMRSNFSSELLNILEQTIRTDNQALLFQNRRGYSPFVICEDCGWIPQCHQCSVSLTYHMYSDNLRCHYCGYKELVPAVCKACGSTRIRTSGFGTEKIEDDLKIYLTDARVKRMDLDTTRNRLSYQRIIKDFDTGELDILVGTQMITKGLDFGRVILVGIMDADRMLYFPDFRSTEKTFQMLTQVSGRAGRRKERGLVLIQTSNPGHAVFDKVIRNDYEGMAVEELQERKKFNYPPFSRLIEVIFKHRDEEISARIAQTYTRIIKKELGTSRVLGPEEPLIAKIRNEYLNHIMIKLTRDKLNLHFVKSLLEDTAVSIMNIREFRKGRIIFNVDPV